MATSSNAPTPTSTSTPSGQQPVSVAAPIVPATAPTASNPGATGANYGAEQIKVLEGLEAVRQRPGMYIGGTGLNALHHLVYEVVDNSIDEAMAGHATTVSVTIHPDGSCSVIDDGRGIPTDPIKHEKPEHNGKPAVEVVLTVLHAGGKFGQEGSAYKVSGGLHGVGVSCVNALSEYLTCEIHRDGKVHSIGFERGRVTQPLALVGPIPANSTRKRGTSVTFRPDDQIFPDTRFNIDTLANRIRELAFLNPGVTLKLTDERVNTDGKIFSQTYKAERGVPEYVEYLNSGRGTMCPVVSVRKENPEEHLSVEVAFQYHDGYNETLLTFANNINNKDGGTHGQGFKTALTRALNAYARKAGIIKDKDPVPSGEDLREGITAIVSVKLPNPAFNNQPKEKLLNPEIEAFVSNAVNDGLESWLEEHPSDAKKLCLKGIIAAQAREAARKARELTRRKSALESGSMPAKLRDCKSKGDDTELFIVEGDSAGGSATQGRNVENQAILPLKGKIINVEKARLDKVLGFEEVRVLIQALRCGIGDDFDATKLRYQKIIIMTDADVDGSHIRTLLLTFFFRQMPELIARGHIYAAQPPLYAIEKVAGRQVKGQYVINDGLMESKLTELGLANAQLSIRDVNSLDGRAAPREIKRLTAEQSRRALNFLSRLNELVIVCERRGSKFVDLLASRSSDPTGKYRLPSHRVSWRGGDLFAWSEHDALELIDNRGLKLADNASEADAPNAANIRELHENREMERIFVDLTSLGLDIADYSLKREESASGDKLPSKYAWVLNQPMPEANAAKPTTDDAETARNEGGDEGAESDARAKKAGKDLPRRGGNIVEAENLSAIVEALHEIGSRGMEIKRFKGLGEMDAAQLWETTMDPDKRVLLRITCEIAGQADKLFSTLMGEEVEPRRRFIEEHALDVKVLDI
ncbi:MAG: DNA gyrase subunit B [Planctomycetes bacterium]|nr:DNA gyrase subunit B [Planctomycetota bacterium]